MDSNLTQIKKQVYDKCSLQITGFQTEPESKEYDACQFKLNGLKIISRSSKITPKKTGQFVTFWKRNGDGIIEPFHETDPIDYFIVNVKSGEQLGQFVFPQPVLIKQGILSTQNKEGKRAFRVYPPWETAQNKQAQRTQKWQLGFFYVTGDTADLDRIRELYTLDEN